MVGSLKQQKAGGRVEKENSLLLCEMGGLNWLISEVPSVSKIQCV